MFSKKNVLFYSFCLLSGFLAFSQQTEGNANLAGATSDKIYFFYRRPSYPRDCKEVLDQCSVKNSSGVFVIKPDGYPYPFEVYCNNNNGSDGWTVFMRRFDGSLVFSRNWTDYKKGFGFLSSEFWLGNEKLAFLTNQERYELGVDVTISNGLRAFITYSHFRIRDEWGHFALASLGIAELPPGPLPPFCPTNMVYKICTCERNCQTPTICQNNCQEASTCVCPDGFFLRGSDCVTPEECQCYSATANKVIPMGESFINDQCSTRCSCSESGLTCSDYGCDPNARCISYSEGGQCVCNTGFIGDGRDCRPICSTNMIYKTCTCERTCDTPQSCQNNCQEASRCVCPDGFFLRGSDCVTPEECPCYSTTANKVIPIGESHINSQCSQQCSCSRSGLSCNNYGCDQNAQCTSTREGGRCACNTGFIGDGRDCRPICNTGYLPDGSSCRRPKDCDEVPSVEGYVGSGLYYILPSNWQEFQVYCNMSGGRWTVFQRRVPGSSRSFYQSWDSYKGGFGELNEAFWLGNDKIHYLTSQKNYQLRIDITDSANRHFRAQYNRFRIGSEGIKYRITVLGTYSGNAGYDAMRDAYNQPFTTYDQDNDDWDGAACGYFFPFGSCRRWRDHYVGNCAVLQEGAWWYKYRSRANSPGGCDRTTSYYDSYDSARRTCCEDNDCLNCGAYAFSCAYANLNGRERGDKGKTIIWHGLNGNDCGIKYTEMKIRPL